MGIVRLRAAGQSVQWKEYVAYQYNALLGLNQIFGQAGGHDWASSGQEAADDEKQRECAYDHAADTGNRVCLCVCPLSVQREPCAVCLHGLYICRAGAFLGLGKLLAMPVKVSAKRFAC